MADLIQEIANLSREQALEASQFVGRRILVDKATGEAEQTALKQLIENPFQNIKEIEQLARLLLFSAALTPEYEGITRKAVEGAGKKNFVLGGAEIVVLAMISLGALHVIVTRGKISETLEIKEEKDKDGKVTTTINKQVKYGIGLNLATVLRNYLGDHTPPS